MDTGNLLSKHGLQATGIQQQAFIFFRRIIMWTSKYNQPLYFWKFRQIDVFRQYDETSKTFRVASKI